VARPRLDVPSPADGGVRRRRVPAEKRAIHAHDLRRTFERRPDGRVLDRRAWSARSPATLHPCFLPLSARSAGTRRAS
jgi:hypothetical protein